MKKIIISIFTIFLILLTSNLGFQNIKGAQTPIQLENGNWDLGYTPNDTTSYYEGLDGLEGEAFVEKLNDIISTGVTHYKYGRSVNQTAYHLRTLDEHPLDNTKVILIYSGLEQPKTADGNTWAQEHVWAKSKGFGDEKYRAYTDLHHLRPVNPSLNSSKNNHDVGNVSEFAGKISELLYGNKSISLEDKSERVFEPRDAVKGDVARILFYMDVRYAGKDDKDPNLTLVNTISSKTTVGDGYFGHLDSLLKWHEQDPVDDYELRRNDLAYGIQGNRNPFVDHPEFVKQVYNYDEFSDIDPDDPEYNQNKANVVIEAIDAIGEVSLESLNKILKAENLYNKLNEHQQILVINHNALLEARTKYNELYDAIQVFEEYSADFSETTGLLSSYAPNRIGILEEREWLFSYSWQSGSNIRLGSNTAGAAVLPDKFKSFYATTEGAALEMDWDIENATYIKLNFGTNTGPITNIDLFVSYDQGTTYQKLDRMLTGTLSSPTSIEAYVTPGDEVRFALVITGSAMRLGLGQVTILRHANIFKAINNINDFDTDLTTLNYNLITTIDNIVAELSEDELKVVNNYELYLSRKETFNNLLQQKLTETNLLVSEIYDSFFADIFDESNYLIIDDFIQTNKNLKEVLESELQNKEKLTELIEIYTEVILFKTLALQFDKTNIDRDLVSQFCELYDDLSAQIKEIIASNEYYDNLTKEILKSEKKYITEFESLNTLSSLMFDYKNTSNGLELIESSLKMRFGAVLSNQLYSNLLLEGNNVEFGIKVNSLRIPLTPVQVAYPGASTTDPQGEYWQFALILSNIPLADINKLSTYQVYVKIDDTYYYMQSTTHSFVTVASAYLDSSLEEITPHLDILNYIASLEN